MILPSECKRALLGQCHPGMGSAGCRGLAPPPSYGSCDHPSSVEGKGGRALRGGEGNKTM